MVWQPAAYYGSCNSNASAPLSLICFLVQYLSGSNDEILKDIYGNQDVNENEYDFIIVGAGAAGCVVANRLSEETNWQVLLLEAGDEEPRITGISGISGIMIDSSIDYGYVINDTGSVYTYPRGKVMGGSTSINGMLYIRGSKADYDDWANSGNEGWSWADVLPYFKKSENARDPEILAKYAEYHGTGGYLTVEQFPENDKNTYLFVDAFKEAGLAETDYNKGDQIGVGRTQYTNVHGARLSANGAFIRPIRGKRSNLVVKPNSRVTKIIVDEKTKRATGVEYQTKNGDKTVKVQVSAKKEVIVSAGTIDSPKLLMVSGIGPKDDLEQLNITVIQDLPVGKNLRDHFIASSLLLISNNTQVLYNDQEVQEAVFQWINTHEGRLIRGINVQAFYQTKFENKSGAADIQFGVGGRTQKDNTLSNWTIDPILVKPISVGYVKLNKTNPIDYQPEIGVNHLTDQDVEAFVEGLKFARKVADAQVFKDAGLTLSMVPIMECKDFTIYSDDYMRCFVRNTAGGFAHAVGTCKMGPQTDKDAVVDSTLKVHGITGLRVIDASIMPDIVRGNTMAATYMIGEKGSDMIKKDNL